MLKNWKNEKERLIYFTAEVVKPFDEDEFLLPLQSFVATLDETNENKIIFPLEEVKQSYKTFKNTPLNLNHEQNNIVGVNISADIKYYKNKKPELWVSSILWKFIAPDISAWLSENNKPAVSMEVYVKDVECSVCHQIFDYVQAKLGGGCEHLDKGADRIAHGLYFAGLSILLPPKQPAFKDAEVKEFEEDELPSVIEIQKLDSEALKELHQKLHEYWKEEDLPYSAEEIYNTHLFIVKEFEKRGIEHSKKDSLDEVLLEKFEYQELSKLLELFRNTKPIQIIPKVVSLVGSSIKTDNPNDLDFCLRLGGSPEELIDEIKTTIALQIRNFLRDAGITKEPHIFTTLTGAHGSNYPLFDLVLAPSVIEKEDFAKFPTFKPLKTLGGYGELTFSSDNLEGLYETWAQGYLNQGIPLVVEEKFDGFRAIAYKEDDIKITSEDTPKPLNQYLPNLIEQLKEIKDSFVLDGELELYAGEDIPEEAGLNFSYKKGEKIERIDMKSFLKEKPAGKYYEVYHPFDLVWFEGKELFNTPLYERKKLLHQIVKNTKNIILTESIIVKNKNELFKAIKKVAKKQYSEGAMVKSLNSLYPKNGRTSDWAKVKNYKELIVKIVKKEKTKAGTFIYTCALSDGTIIGKTYATQLDLNEGDLLEIRVAEVKYEDGKLSWDNPIVHSQKPAGTHITTPEEAIALSKARRQALELYQWLYEVAGKCI